MKQQSEIAGGIFNFDLMKRILRLAYPFKKMFILATLLAIALAIIGPLRPYLVQLTVDNGILQYNWSILKWFTILLIAILIIESIFRFYFNFITSWLGQNVIHQLRLKVFHHVLSLNLRFFDKVPIGTITTRTINDVEAVNEIFSQGIITIISELLTLLAVITLMFITDWKLTLVSLATFPFFVWSTYVFKEKIKIAFQAVRAAVAKLNAFIQEHISGMKIIQIFNVEERELEKFKSINAEHREANIRSIWYFSIFFPVVEILSASSIGLLVWYGSNSVLQHQTTIGVLIAFILYIYMLFRPLRLLADKFNTLQMGIVAADRIFRLLDHHQKISNDGKIKPDKLKGKIEFRNVWFAYEGEDYVLKDVSFKIEPGQTFAIVGPTGSGKTSIINILNRYYEIQKGQILVDDIPIEAYDIATLRSRISVVLQDVFLFSGTVYENITLNNDAISREKVIETAKRIGAHDFIERLPGKYDYRVMERGATLSLGQRQLIAFIRALVYDPDILILDEATSSVDQESEKLIQEAIVKMVSNRTSLIIAHRLSTIQHADLILVLDRGKIIEQGTHAELLSQNGFYRKLYESQIRNHEIGL